MRKQSQSVHHRSELRPVEIHAAEKDFSFLWKAKTIPPGTLPFKGGKVRASTAARANQ